MSIFQRPVLISDSRPLDSWIRFGRIAAAGEMLTAMPCSGATEQPRGQPREAWRAHAQYQARCEASCRSCRVGAGGLVRAGRHTLVRCCGAPREQPREDTPGQLLGPVPVLGRLWATAGRSGVSERAAVAVCRW